MTASLLSLTPATSFEEHLPQHPGVVVVAGHDHWLRRSWAGQRIHLNTKNLFRTLKTALSAA